MARPFHSRGCHERSSALCSCLLGQGVPGSCLANTHKHTHAMVSGLGGDSCASCSSCTRSHGGFLCGSDVSAMSRQQTHTRSRARALLRRTYSRVGSRLPNLTPLPSTRLSCAKLGTRQVPPGAVQGHHHDDTLAHQAGNDTSHTNTHPVDCECPRQYQSPCATAASRQTWPATSNGASQSVRRKQRQLAGRWGDHATYGVPFPFFMLSRAKEGTSHSPPGASVLVCDT